MDDNAYPTFRHYQSDLDQIVCNAKGYNPGTYKDQVRSPPRLSLSLFPASLSLSSTKTRSGLPHAAPSYIAPYPAPYMAPLLLSSHSKAPSAPGNSTSPSHLTCVTALSPHIIALLPATLRVSPPSHPI